MSPQATETGARRPAEQAEGMPPLKEAVAFAKEMTEGFSNRGDHFAETPQSARWAASSPVRGAFLPPLTGEVLSAAKRRG